MLELELKGDPLPHIDLTMIQASNEIRLLNSEQGGRVCCVCYQYTRALSDGHALRDPLGSELCEVLNGFETRKCTGPIFNTHYV
jgi:hypothetical protein